LLTVIDERQAEHNNTIKYRGSQPSTHSLR
jgi:hypothetical protein